MPNDYAFSALTLAFGKHVQYPCWLSIYRDKTDAQAYRHNGS